MILLSIAGFVVLFYIGLRITGAVLAALLWLCVSLPIPLVLWMLGLACCCTILLIPVGIKLFTIGGRIVLDI